MVTDEEVKASYGRDESGYEGMPDVVVFPKSVEEVEEVVRLANEYKVPVVLKGGGLGLTGGRSLFRGNSHSDEQDEWGPRGKLGGAMGAGRAWCGLR